MLRRRMGRTMFINIQHPAQPRAPRISQQESLQALADGPGKPPRSATVVITTTRRQRRDWRLIARLAVASRAHARGDVMSLSQTCRNRLRRRRSLSCPDEDWLDRSAPNALRALTRYGDTTAMRCKPFSPHSSWRQSPRKRRSRGSSIVSRQLKPCACCRLIATSQNAPSRRSSRRALTAIRLSMLDGEQNGLGFVDIADPATPRPSGFVAMSGELTSVTVRGPRAYTVADTSPNKREPSGYAAVVDVASRREVMRCELAVSLTRLL